MNRIAIDKVLFLLTIPAFWGLVVWGAASCAGERSKVGDTKEVAAGVKHGATFRLPDIPPALTEPKQRAAYLVAHYWDHFNFADQSSLTSPDVLEQLFVNYLDLLPHATRQVADSSLRATLVRMSAGRVLMDWFSEQFERYLYDPNSPMRDEERYAVVLEYLIADSNIDSLQKIRPAHQLEEINKNRVGRIAANFTYTLPNGKTGKLHGLNAEYTLVVFNNPDCGDCERTKEVLKASPVVSELVDRGRMQVLALYTDEYLTLWRNHWSDMPAEWINARDASPDLVVKNKLYAIRAIPSLYLLDRDKRVLLKDALAEQVVAALENEGR